MNNAALEAELDWVDKNPRYYNGPEHQEDVKHNITVNYLIREIEGRIKATPKADHSDMRVRLSELRESLRPNRAENCVITCPSIPKTQDELNAVGS